MKPHLIIICTTIVLLAFLILGFRGLAAGGYAASTFLLGIRLGKREQAMADLFRSFYRRIASVFTTTVKE